MSCSAASSVHDEPSCATNSRLGSVPAYSAPSAGPIATEKTLGSGSSIRCHVAPPSSLRRAPSLRVPTSTRSPLVATHCAPSPSSTVAWSSMRIRRSSRVQANTGTSTRMAGALSVPRT
jgi:hypothetical protein